MPRTPGAPRSPLAQLSPGNRNRIIGARAYGIPFSIIADQENCSPSGAYATVKNAALRAGQFSRPRGRPQTKLSERDKRRIYRAIEQFPKITAQELVSTVVISFLQFVPSAYAASLHLLHIVKLSSQLINDELVSP